MTDFMQALAAKGQPDQTFEALAQLVQDTIGVKLFTTMVIDRDRNVARRNFTNMPDAYPVSGEKPRHKNRWTDIVEDQHKTFVANSIEEIADVFRLRTDPVAWLRKLHQRTGDHRRTGDRDAELPA